MKISKNFAMVAITTLLLAVGVVAAVPAQSAQFTGTNGVIQFSTVQSGGANFTGSVTLINPDGTNSRQVVADGWWASQNSAASKLSYVTNYDAAAQTSNQLCTANFDGSGQNCLLTSPSGKYFSATTMSADGTKIAYVLRSFGSGTSDLFVINFDGTGNTNLTNGVLLNINWPQFSQDGTTIVFNALVTPQIFTIPAAGGSATQITNGNGHRSPSWTIDGKILARAHGSGSEIVRMNADGTNLVVLLTPASIGLGSVDWPGSSPDGTKMVFSGVTPGFGFALWVANIDGTNAVRITPNEQAVDRALPVWSSGDGTYTPPTPNSDPVVPTYTG